MNYKELIRVIDSRVADAFYGRAYDVILESHEASEIGDGDEVEGVKQYANGIDWSEIEITHENITHSQYIDTVNGVDIFYDYGAGYYFFSPEKNDSTEIADSSVTSSIEDMYFNSHYPEEMGLDYEAYKEYCEINDTEPSAEDSEDFYEWQRNEIDVDWDNLLWEIKHYDKIHYGNYFVDANLGLWNGNKHGFDVFDSLEKAFWACVDNMDYVVVEPDGIGGLAITAVHHDGTNHFTINKLSDEGYDAYLDSQEEGKDFNAEDFKESL